MASRRQTTDSDDEPPPRSQTDAPEAADLSAVEADYIALTMAVQRAMETPDNVYMPDVLCMLTLTQQCLGALLHGLGMLPRVMGAEPVASVAAPSELTEGRTHDTTV